jgi:hypothetical protein
VHSNKCGFQECIGCQESISHCDDLIKTNYLCPHGHKEAIERDLLDGQAQQPTLLGMRGSGFGYTPPISRS